jgi:hypothetical protein
LDGGGVATQPHHIPVVTVIVHKDDSGYGMKVSGDKPVYVQSVKEGKCHVYSLSHIHSRLFYQTGDTLPETAPKRGM